MNSRRTNKSQGRYRDKNGMNSQNNKQKMKGNGMSMNRNSSFGSINRSQPSEHFENKDMDFPLLGDNNIQDRKMHDRFLFVIMNMVGTKVEATVKNGSIFEGILHGINTEGELSVCLKMAKKIVDKSNKNNNNINGSEQQQQNLYIQNLIIPNKELVQLFSKNLELNKFEKAINQKDSFKTDTAISGRSGDIFERKLQRWEPEKIDDKTLGVSLELSEKENGNDTHWDQFETNEKLFGITTDFDEEIYTTPLDRSRPDFKKREQEAMKVAAEIEKSTTENIHLAEERNQFIDDSGIDEEDRYGAVIRKPGKYIPPNIRRKMELEQQKYQNSKKNNENVNKEDQKDKLKNNDIKSSNTNNDSINNNKSKVLSSNNNTKASSYSGAVLNNKTVANKPNKEMETLSENKATTKISTPTTTTNQNSKPNTPVFSTKNPLVKLDKKIQLENSILLKSGINQTMQENLVNHFRQFSKKEKEHLAQKKQAIMKREKEGIFSEFKSFSKNFKLPDFKDQPSDSDLLASTDKSGKDTVRVGTHASSKTTTNATSTDSTTNDDNSNKNNKKETTIKSHKKEQSLNNNTASTNVNAKQDTTSKSMPVASTTQQQKKNNSEKDSKANEKMNKITNNSSVTTVKKTASAATTITNNTKTKENSESSEKMTSSTSSASTKSKNKSSFKFNIEAREFKPNPSAVEFVPSHSKNLGVKNNANMPHVNNNGNMNNNSVPFEKGNGNNKRNNQKGNLSVRSIFIKGFLKTQNANIKNHTNVNYGSNTWNYGTRPYRSQFSAYTVAYEEAIYYPIEQQQFGYYGMQMHPAAYPYPVQIQGQPAMIRRPFIPGTITMQPPPAGYPGAVNYVPIQAATAAPYGTPIATAGGHGRPGATAVYPSPPNIINTPLGPATRMYQAAGPGPILVPAYPAGAGGTGTAEMIPVSGYPAPNTTVMVPAGAAGQPSYVIEPAMLSTAAPVANSGGIPQTVFLTESLMGKIKK